jgi:hypothetical protein
MPPIARLWTHEETAVFLRVEESLLAHLVVAGGGPQCYWVGRHRRYDPDGVTAWLRSTGEGWRGTGRHAARPQAGGGDAA